MPTFSSTKRVSFDDFVFFVDENVYDPAEDSFLFAENVSVGEGDLVLDIGTGCGILGILAAKRARWVIASDVNPYALGCARGNAALNGVQDRLSFLQGDLFSPLCKLAKFDIVFFNAPYLPSGEVTASSWAERAWAGGKSGRVVIDRFIRDVKNHLRKTGHIQLMQSTFAGVAETIRLFKRSGMNAKITAELGLPFFERLFLIEARFS